MRTLKHFCLLLCTLVSFSAFADFSSSSSFNGGNSFVPVDEAFPIQVSQSQHQIKVEWDVAPDYYLYQSRMSFKATDATIVNVDLVDGAPYKDEFFGDVNIYTEPVVATLTLDAVTSSDAELTVEYQGCAKAGFCYPPERRTFPISLVANAAATDIGSSAAPLSQDASFASKLGDNGWTPVLFLLLGVGLAFTPCVFPMYPIITSIVVGQGNTTPRHAFKLSFIYVQGMALTYTLLGLVVASMGVQFQAALQHPAILITISVLFVLLALSMFGVYTLQLPSSVQTKLNQWSNAQSGGNTAGVFTMGAISGLVCSPCTTAPLSGALLYVAQSGDLLTGALALYALALGMGIPLILVAVYGNKLLPKSGLWMERVKVFFGFILLAAPLFFLERILPDLWSAILWALLGFATFGWLFKAKNSFEFGGWKQSLIGIVAVLGIVASTKPLLDIHAAQQAPASSIEFVKIDTVFDLNKQLARAKLEGKPVMLDFYADWCSACKEFEKYTFHDAQVEPLLENMVLLQADVTKNRVQDIELLKELGVLGLPTIEFWNERGQKITQARVTGFMNADRFSQHLNAHLTLQP
ncbi:thiol:disulfide interchange protein [Vibrio sp. qd031]|uniref:protein-disulfide reductase DsbD n=1 Tax=Vibrio sp. qd031 TaxID=1603038 RepID=UPI000A1112B7|nr:protein-disulfide reductase DsbD [Vibrio sp. qd031]ORT51906.1 thiol:disulfide interchange protein [Vibrio sp. qd031]